MIYRIRFMLKYFGFWLCLFWVQKLLFLVYNYSESFDVAIINWIRIFIYGLRLDLSSAGYLSVLPFLLIAILAPISKSILKYTIQWYTYVTVVLVSLAGAIDMNLYSYSGFRLDITPLIYLKNPQGVAGSVPLHEYLLVSGIFLLLSAVAIMVYNRFVKPDLVAGTRSNWKLIPIALLMTVVLFLPIRGSFGVAPVNLSSAYFHKNQFVNHSGINVFWNIAYSISEKDNFAARYNYYNSDEAGNIVKGLYTSKEKAAPAIKKNANVLLIVLESFSNKVISNFGGLTGVAPYLDNLTQNSIAFSNFHASGDRSDKGLISLFSGYPAQPVASIMAYPSKTQKLPFLLEPFHNQGYSTVFYYGGDLDFANFRAYFTNPYLNKLVTGNDFPSELKTQKWGVPDEYLFDKFYSELNGMKEPFFAFCFTLSSHEPFDVPIDPKFGTESRSDLSKTSYFYTDSCLGIFLEKAKDESWWNNTLVIITADHGSRTPGNSSNRSPEKYNVPMLWTGGAVISEDTVLGKFCSQTDLSKTLLNQFGFASDQYIFSKDMLAASTNSFALYFYNHGVGYLDDTLQLVYDCTSNKTVKNDWSDQNDNRYGKAYLQVLMEDFESK
jgi:phosphoglycerol transferase MdoB-like AlkP superfamily enzyme